MRFQSASNGRPDEVVWRRGARTRPDWLSLCGIRPCPQWRSGGSLSGGVLREEAGALGIGYPGRPSIAVAVAADSAEGAVMVVAGPCIRWACRVCYWGLWGRPCKAFQGAAYTAASYRGAPI